MRGWNPPWLLILTGLLFFQCDLPREEAIGPNDEIVVLSEDPNWNLVHEVLKESLGRVIRTPQHETLYSFRRITPDQLADNLKVKNLMILSRLEVSSRISDQLRSMLPDSTLKRVRESPTAVVLRRDAYAAGQTLLIVPAKDPQDLKLRLHVQARTIRDFFEESFQSNEIQFIYRSGEQFEMAQGYFNQYGWYIRMMHSFVEIRNDPADRFVWLGRDFPYRWMTISWMPVPDGGELEVVADSLLRQVYSRNLDGLKLNPDFLQREEVWFNDQSAVRYSGLWEDPVDVKGGPFVAYVFYEPQRDRIYLLNALVFAPDRRKLGYLRQLDVILHTFRPTPPAD